MTFDFTNIPIATIVEEIDEADLKATRLAEFQALNPTYESFLESDPVVKLIEALVAVEVKIRLRLNQTYQASLVAFAEGSDLDQIALDVGVTRKVIQAEDLSAIPPVAEILETDEDFRQRIFYKASGQTSETNGYYAYNALTASNLVKDVKVISEEAGAVTIYIQSTEGDGVPDSDLLDVVYAAIAETEIVKVSGITVTVVPIELVDIDLYADIYLESGQSVAVFTNLQDTFETAFAAHQKIGKDITLSWMHKTLMQDGIQRVELYTDVGKTTPFETVVIANNELANFDTISLTNAGSTY